MSDSTRPTDESVPPPLTGVQWLTCGVAALGFAFDIYELLMLPLIVGPALQELTGARPGTPAFNDWVGLLFWIPALAGGVFGLLGGYLTDRFGRRSVLVWSILLYAFSALAAGYATSAWWLLVFRTTTFVGVCVEFVAAVAWLAELFPHPKQREAVLGYTQAFSSIGGLLVTGAYYLAVTYGDSLPAVYGAHAPWRYTLMSGVIPALPLIIIRPFLPDSPTWRAKKEAGTLKRPSLAAIFQGDLRRTTLVTTLMFACSYGAAFGAIQHLPRIVPGLRGGPRPARVPPSRRSSAPCRPGRRSAGSSAASCSRISPCGSSRAGACSACSRSRAWSSCPSCSCTRRATTSACSSGASSWAGSSPSRSSASGGTTCRACIPRTCAGRARASPPTWAGA